MAVVTSFIGIGAVAVAIIGCLTAPLSAPLRILAGVAGACLLFQGWITALVGCGLLAIVFAADQRGVRKTREV